VNGHAGNCAGERLGEHHQFGSSNGGLGQRALEAAECLGEVEQAGGGLDDRDAMASSFNGQRGGLVSGKVGISGSFQHVRDPGSPFVVDGQQFPGAGGGAVRRHPQEGHRAGVGAEELLVEDVQLPPAEDRPQGSGGPPGCGWRRASAAALALAFTA